MLDPGSLNDAVKFFSNSHAAHVFLAEMRWPGGPVCPRCGSENVRYLADYERFQCSKRHSHRQFTVKTGSAMEGSRLALEKWAVAYWAAKQNRSVSSYALHRALGITQKSAWLMQKRINKSLAESP